MELFTSPGFPRVPPITVLDTVGDFQGFKVCVHVYVCMYVCMCMCVCACARMCVCAYEYVCVCAYVDACVCMRLDCKVSGRYIIILRIWRENFISFSKTAKHFQRFLR